RDARPERTLAGAHQMEIPACPPRGLKIIDASEIRLAQALAQAPQRPGIGKAGALIDPDTIEIRRGPRQFDEGRRRQQGDLGALVMRADRRRRPHRLDEIAERAELDDEDSLGLTWRRGFSGGASLVAQPASRSSRDGRCRL